MAAGPRRGRAADRAEPDGLKAPSGDNLRGMEAATGAGVYELPQEFLDFRDTIRQIAKEKVAPRAAEIDEKAEYPHDLRELFAEHDLLGLPFDDEYGGTGTGTLMLNIADRGDRRRPALPRR